GGRAPRSEATRAGKHERSDREPGLPASNAAGAERPGAKRRERESMSTRTYDGPALHDPATYAHEFPYEVFRELRDTDPVSHHDHPAWEDGYWALSRHADVQR